MKAAARAAVSALVGAALAASAAFAGDDAGAAKVRAARDAVFARPEFHYDEPKAAGGLFERVLNWFGDALRGFHERYPAAYALGMIAMVLTLVVLVAHLLWTWRIARRTQFAEDDPHDLESALRRLDPAPFRALALAHAQAGRWDEAVRDLYTALLLTLDRRGTLHYAGHKALLDFRIEAAHDADARSVLDRFADAYPPGSFGRRPPDAQRFRDLVEALDSLAVTAGRRT